MWAIALAEPRATLPYEIINALSQSGTAQGGKSEYNANSLKDFMYISLNI
jgi:hypothetical protein